MDKEFLPKSFTSFRKLLCDCVKYLLKKIISNNTKCYIWNIWKYWWNVTDDIFYVCLYNFSKLWNLFSRVPMGNCFRCNFRQLFISLALRNVKRTVKYLKLFWDKVFVHWKLKLLEFLSDFIVRWHLIKL